MSNEGGAIAGRPGKGAFEWWMVSNFAVGGGFAAFIALLIPPYVTEATGKAAEAGVVMAVISLAAVLGPVLGAFADRYGAHRLVLTGGVGGMALGFVMYAISADSAALLALDAVVLGVSVAAQQAVAPVFVVAAGLPRNVEAKRLTTLNLAYPVGQVVGGALLSVAASAGWTFSQRFWLAAGFMALATVVTWFGSGTAAGRIQVAPTGKADAQRKASLRTVILSTFGVFLLILVLSSVANNGINNQIANILPNVYGIDEVTTSTLISVAGLLNIVLFIAAGAWMSRSGAFAPFAAGTVMRLVGAAAMGALGLVADAPLLLVAAAMQVLYQGSPFTRLAQSAVAVRWATIPAGQALGWVIGASAIGSFVGSIIGGFLADNVGFNAINWMGAVAAGAAVALIVVSLWPAERRKRTEEEESSPD